MEWETVIGLEVHVQLLTKSKLFSGAATQYGAEPNTQACAVDLALPGVLPVMNREAARMAAKFGLAIGAAVNTVQEAQNLVFPVIIPLVLGLVCFPVVLESPDGALAVTLSLIPFLTPLLMFLRIIVLTPPWWQIGLSVVLLGASILAVLWVSARIYRVGILMYGKKPTFPELVRWVGRA